MSIKPPIALLSSYFPPPICFKMGVEVDGVYAHFYSF